jgi:hypothetical protein
MLIRRTGRALLAIAPLLAAALIAISRCEDYRYVYAFSYTLNGEKLKLTWLIVTTYTMSLVDQS